MTDYIVVFDLRENWRLQGRVEAASAEEAERLGKLHILAHWPQISRDVAFVFAGPASKGAGCAGQGETPSCMKATG